MEKPETELEIFSPILLQDYIRLMTAAHYIEKGAEAPAARFKISAENFTKMEAEPLKAALIGLTLTYLEKEQVLEVTADENFKHLYENKIMNEVARVFAVNYGKRYASTIIAEDICQ